MDEQYKWNYKIKVRTKDGEYDYERETLEKIEDILERHPEHNEVRATHVKKLVRNERQRNIRKNN